MPAPAATLLDRFHAVVARHPGHLAVVAGDRRLTYAGLDALTSVLAAQIRAQRRDGAGIGAYLASRGLAEVVAMWSVLKAGLAFAPVDPEAPPAWIDDVLDDLDADILLVDPAHAPLAAALSHTALPRARLRFDAPAAAAPAPVTAVTGDSLAWITYTSGSTGRPKGVVQDHASVARLAAAYAGVFGLTPQDRVLVLHPTMTWDIFGALLTGATLCPFDLVAGGAAGLVDWIDTHGVTVYRSFPTTFRAVVQALDGRAAFAPVRAVQLSGETVTADDVALVERHFPASAALYHVFGSAEAGPVAACRLGRGTIAAGQRLPLGPPLEAVTVEVIGEDGSPVAPGEPGEIVVRSPFVAAGYWRRAEQTAAVFTAGDGPRRFRMGDLGAWDEAGGLYHHGRADGQLKIRGARIEPGQIESTLRRHPGVIDVAVTAVDGLAGDLQLGAVVATVDVACDAAAMRAFAAAHLPPAGVPHHVAIVTRLPQTASGKVDRLGLATVLTEAAARAAGGTSRTWTTAETRMTRCWRAAFGRADIGADDDFLALGGDSLTAVQLAAHVQREFGVTLEFEVLLDTGTPAALAAHLGLA